MNIQTYLDDIFLGIDELLVELSISGSHRTEARKLRNKLRALASEAAPLIEQLDAIVERRSRPRPEQAQAETRREHREWKWRAGPPRRPEAIA